MNIFRHFKSLLPVNLSFVGAGKTVYLEVDSEGKPLLYEARKRLIEGGIVEVKVVAEKETPGQVAKEQQEIDATTLKGVK